MNHTLTLAAAIQEFIRVSGLWLIPFFPALGAFINLVFGALIQKKFGRRAVHVLAVGSMLLSSATALFFFFVKLLPAEPASRFLLDRVFPMIHIGAVQVDMAFAMDPLGGLMAVMVTVVATAIHIYSCGYMAEEPSAWRYFGYLNLFCFAMLLLVLGDNFVLMFFGWEGVGLCSYLLIGFWYKDREKAKAGMKAFVVNRIGDFGFIVGLFTLFWGLLSVWEAVPGKLERVDDGRCVEVRTAAMPAPEHGGHGAHAGHEAEAGAGAGAAASALELDRCEASRVKPRCGCQPAVAVGGARKLYLGPTVSFRELKDQLSIEDAGGKRLIGQFLLDYKFWGVSLLVLVTFGFFLGACGKSAQIPLYVWLPDAMAGPTPVSALIHAATMVTAGVYMVARLNFIFILSPQGMTLVATVGALTALYAATIGFFQYDIKKVLAYSTVSQLGYMFVGVGVGAYWVGIYHLLTHAFFKACLFLGSGSVIHGMHELTHHREHEAHKHADQGEGIGHGLGKRDVRKEPDPFDPQDMRNMGGLATLMPHTRWTYLIACLAIAGIPLFAGFYSKDEILWKAFSTGNIYVSGWFIWGLGAVGALCTAFYMFRSYYLTFHGRPPTHEHRAYVHESPRSMTGVLWFLAGGAVATSLLGSFLFVPGALSHKEPWLESFLQPTTAMAEAFQHQPRLGSGAVELILMALSVGLAATGIFAARMLYKDLSRSEARLQALRDRSRIHVLIFNKYFVDEIYDLLVVRPFVAFTRMLGWIDLRIVDGLVNACGWGLRMLSGLGGWIDRIFVDGAVNLVADATIAAGRRVRRIQTGRVNTYVLGVAFGVVILLFVVWLVVPVTGR